MTTGFNVLNPDKPQEHIIIDMSWGHAVLGAITNVNFTYVDVDYFEESILPESILNCNFIAGKKNPRDYYKQYTNTCTYP